MVLEGKLLKLISLACGYYLDESRLKQINEFLDEKQVQKIDF